MKNITLAMDEKLIEAGRRYAQQHHTTLNALVRDLLRRELGEPEKEHWTDKLFRIADEAGGNSHGWKWNREEIYDREVFGRH